jgi:hypothetical protein
MGTSKFCARKALTLDLARGHGRRQAAHLGCRDSAVGPDVQIAARLPRPAEATMSSRLWVPGKERHRVLVHHWYDDVTSQAAKIAPVSEFERWLRGGAVLAHERDNAPPSDHRSRRLPLPTLAVRLVDSLCIRVSDTDTSNSPEVFVKHSPRRSSLPAFT